MHNETKIVNAASRSHFGSRAISCSNVHSVFPFTSASGFALSKCLQPNFLCLQLSHPFSWLPIARVKMQCTLPCPGRRRCLRMLGLLMARAMTSMEWPAVQLMNSSGRFVNYYYHSYHLHGVLPITRTTSRPSPTLWSFSHPGLPTLNRSSIPFLPRWRHSQKWNRITAPSLHACARSKEIWSQLQAFQVPQDLGTSLVKTMAPQPQGPMAQDHLMTTETHDEDLILSPAPKMNDREVPSYFDSLANNTSNGLQSGSIPFGKNPICRLVTNLSEFIAKQSVRLVYF